MIQQTINVTISPEGLETARSVQHEKINTPQLNPDLRPVFLFWRGISKEFAMFGFGLSLWTAGHLVPTCNQNGGSSSNTGFLPDQIAGLAGWFDASAFDTLTLAGSEVTAMANRVPNGLNLSAVYSGNPNLPSGGPIYDPVVAGGKPGLVWDAGVNTQGLSLAADATGITEVFVVCQFRFGNELAWPVTNLISSYGAGQPNSLARTVWGTANLLASDAPNNVFAAETIEEVSINGGAFSNTVLPLPLSVMRFSETATDNPGPITLAAFGVDIENPDLPRSWRGHICEILAYVAPLSPAQIADVEGYLYAKWGITP